MLGLALVDVAETLVGLGEALPKPDPGVNDAEMDLEEPIFLHYREINDYTARSICRQLGVPET